MTLEGYTHPGELYLARGDEVNPRRPLFTGDVFENVAIPAVQDCGPAMVIAHPCAMRGSNASLQPHVLMIAVSPHGLVGPSAWPQGHFDRTPLPALIADDFYAGHFDRMGSAETDDLTGGKRLACLSAFGINLLQQRLVWHLTRVDIATFTFHEAFAHTLEEADLLEEWSDTLCDAGWPAAEAATAFEQFIRCDLGDGTTLQLHLREPQRRAAARSACRAEALRVIGSGSL